MFKRILLPVDPARPFGAANKYAVDLAHRFESRMAATYVIDERLLGHVGGEAAATLDTALEWVGQDAIDDFAEHHKDLEVHKSLAYGPTATALFQMVLQSGADLVVVGGYHATAAPHIWGSTVSDVVHHVERPVFVVRADSHLPQAGERIVVPYDGSDRAMGCLPKIALFAREMGAQIELVSVAKGSEVAVAEGILGRGAHIVEEVGVEVTAVVLRGSRFRPRWRTLLSHAKSIHSPLIALSRLGHTSMKTGRSRTVDHLVAHSVIPVWVVRK